MRIFGVLFGAIVSAFLLSAPARAEKLDVSTVTCQQLTDALDHGSKDDQFGMGVILYWIAGYSGTDEQATIIDFDGMKTDFEKIVAQCREQPKVGVLAVSAKFLGENATPQGKDAMDIATITCEKVLDTDKKDEEGLSLILMWLAGYHASVNNDMVFDSEVFEESMKNIGQYCSENTGVGFFTAAQKYMTAE